MKKLYDKLGHCSAINAQWRNFITSNELNYSQPGNMPLHNLLNILNKLDLARWFGD